MPTIMCLSVPVSSTNLPNQFHTVTTETNETSAAACSYKCGMYFTAKDLNKHQELQHKSRRQTTMDEKRPYLCGPVDMKYCTNIFLESLKNTFENVMLKERQLHKKRSIKIAKRELVKTTLKLNQMVTAKLSEEWIRQEKILNETILKTIESHVPYHFKIMVLWSIGSFIISSFLIFLACLRSG